MLTNWDRYYASLLGMVDNVGILAVRNSQLQPQPFGTFLRDVTNQYATYFYVQDSWRVKPSLTLYYGLNYGFQTAPTEANNLQTIMINAQTGALINGPQCPRSKKEQGGLYKARSIIRPLGLKLLARRSVPFITTPTTATLRRAWHFRLESFGQERWFSQQAARRKEHRHPRRLCDGLRSLQHRAKRRDSHAGNRLRSEHRHQRSGLQCHRSGWLRLQCQRFGARQSRTRRYFRVGTDGTLPLPVPSSATSPIIPAVGAEVLSFQVDPFTKTGRSYNFDLSIQRKLPGNMVIEGAFLSRESRDLPQAVNVNSAPYMFKDTASGQTFAQAYDLVANALRNGQAAPTEPFFENQFPGLAAQKNSPTATAYIVGANKGNFTGGNVGTLFANLDAYRRGLGLQAYNSDQAGVEFIRTYIGYANYNAAIVTIAKRMSHGFSFSANYTFAKALDDGISNQNNAGFFSNSFNTSVQYGPSSYDRRSVFNTYYQYDLPAGKGHRFHTGNFVDRIIGGWYTSGIAAAWTGLPLKVSEGSQVWGGGNSSIGATDYMVPVNPLPATTVNHNVSNTTTCSNGIFSGTVAANVGGASGTNLDIFSNPGAAYCDFNYVQLGFDGAHRERKPDAWTVVLEPRHASWQRHQDWRKNSAGILGRFLQRLQSRELRQPHHQLHQSGNIRCHHADLHPSESHQRRPVD